MANNPLYYNSAVDAFTGHASQTLNSATLQIYTGSQPALNAALTGTLLATLTFGATAFGAASAAVATANAITSGTAGNTGTAGYAAIVSSGSVNIMTMSVGTSGADLNLSSLSIVSGATVSCSSFTVTG